MTDHSELKTVETNCGKDRPKAQKALLVQDLSFRDGHQALFDGRGRTEDMIPVAERMDAVGFWAVEVWGGATFETMHALLGENPWERLRTLKRYFKKTPLSMLLRGQSLVGNQACPDDTAGLFVTKAAENGIDIFRVSDALNDLRNFETVAQAIKENKKHFQGCICYAQTEPRLGGDLYNIDYYVEKAKALEAMGADSICIYDTAGILAPYDAYELIKKLKNMLQNPIHLHSHFTTGMSSMTMLKAIEAGVDSVDTCMAPYAYRSSHAAVEPLVVSLMGTDRDTGFDIDALVEIDEILEKEVMPKYQALLDDSKVAVIDVKTLQHQIPSDMHADLMEQLCEMDAPDKIKAVHAELLKVRKDLGQIPFASPTGHILGKQAVNNVLFDTSSERYKMVSAQLQDFCYGLYGKTPVQIDSEIQAKVLKGYGRGETPVNDRPGKVLAPALDGARDEIGDLAVDDEDLLLYALFPVSGKKYLKQKYGKEQMPESFKPVSLEDVEKHRQMVEKLKKGELIERSHHQEIPEKSENVRTFNVYVEGAYFEVGVDEVGGVPVVQYAAPQAAAAPALPEPAVPAAPPVAAAPPVPSMPVPKPAPKAPTPRPEKPKSAVKDKPAASGSGTPVAAPMPGVVIKYEKKVGDSVSAGDTVVIIEAMKMENALPAPASGVIAAIHYSGGDSVAKNDVLAVIE